MMSSMDNMLVEEGAKATGMSPSAWWSKSKTIKFFRSDFEKDGRMLYLRHVVYFQAIATEQHMPYAYSHFLYLREDNIFINPSFSLATLAVTLDGAHNGISM